MIGSALAKNVSTAGYASEKMKVVKLTDLHQFSFFQTHSIVLQYVSYIWQNNFTNKATIA